MKQPIIITIRQENTTHEGLRIKSAVELKIPENSVGKNQTLIVTFDDQGLALKEISLVDNTINCIGENDNPEQDISRCLSLSTDSYFAIM